MNNNKMHLIESHNGYDFYTKNDMNKTLFNIIPTGQVAPLSGHFNKNFIEKIKHVQFSEKLYNLIARNVETGKITLLTDYPDFIEKIEALKSKFSNNKKRELHIVEVS